MSVNAIANGMGIAFEKGLNTIWKGLKYNRKGRSAWRHYVDKQDSRKKWVVYASLPESTRCRIDHYYKDVELCYYNELLTNEALARIDVGDRAYFASAKVLKGGRTLSREKAGDLAEACGWMRVVSGDYWQGKWRKKTDFYQWAAKAIFRRDLYGLRIKSGAVLRRKIKRWKDMGRDSLLPGMLNNNNAGKLCEAGRTRIIALYAQPLKPTYRIVAEIYNREAMEKGWEPLSEERIRQVLSTPEKMQICNVARNGTGVARSEMERTIKRRKPSYADALWTMDGTAMQLLFVNDKGKLSSGLYVYVVVDGYSEAIIGYAIGSAETSVLVQTALRKATGLHNKMPAQLQYDNSSANKSSESQQLFERLARVNFATQPYNGKSKIIEAIFGRFEQSNLRYFKNFKGGNITAKSKSSRANPDFIMKQVKAGELPVMSAVVAQFELAVQVHNNTMTKHGQTRIERYMEPHTKRKEMPYLDQVEMFWVERKNKGRYTKDGLVIEINKERKYYEVERERGVEDMAFRRQYLGDSFVVRYDPGDLSHINLYTNDGAWVATASEKYEYPMARVDFNEGEGAMLAESLKERSDYIEGLRSEVDRIVDEDEGALLSYELVHKDALNRMEGGLQQELLEQAGVIYTETTKKEKKRRYELNTSDEADGSIIE